MHLLDVIVFLLSPYAGLVAVRIDCIHFHARLRTRRPNLSLVLCFILCSSNFRLSLHVQFCCYAGRRV